MTDENAFFTTSIQLYEFAIEISLIFKLNIFIADLYFAFDYPKK